MFSTSILINVNTLKTEKKISFFFCFWNINNTWRASPPATPPWENMPHHEESQDSPLRPASCEQAQTQTLFISGSKGNYWDLAVLARNK